VSEPLGFFATCPKGIEGLLAAELTGFVAADIRETVAGVAFAGTLETAYRACLWSRLASRILMTLDTVPAEDAAALYAGVHDMPWEQHLGADGTLAVDFTGTNEQITHTLFGAQKVKDAVVDRFRERDGRRPSVDLRNPDLRINVHLAGAAARVSLDLSGESLHKRGYRDETIEAPLKENLAAAVLIRAGWPAIAAAGGPLLDPMCGSGSIAIEAALIAGDIAPGLLREYFGFLRWPQHDAALWERLLAEARARREAGLRRFPAIVGTDHDPVAVRAALANVTRAGLTGRIHVEKRELADAAPPKSSSSTGSKRYWAAAFPASLCASFNPTAFHKLAKRWSSPSSGEWPGEKSSRMEMRCPSTALSGSETSAAVPPNGSNGTRAIAKS